MPDFSKHQIIWAGGHGLDRAELRGKPPQEVERVIRESTFQEVGSGKDRWEILGCIGGFVSRVIVQDIGDQQLVVVTVYGEDMPCR